MQKKIVQKKEEITTRYVPKSFRYLVDEKTFLGLRGNVPSEVFTQVAHQINSTAKVQKLSDIDAWLWRFGLVLKKKRNCNNNTIIDEEMVMLQHHTAEAQSRRKTKFMTMLLRKGGKCVCLRVRHLYASHNLLAATYTY